MKRETEREFEPVRPQSWGRPAPVRCLLETCIFCRRHRAKPVQNGIVVRPLQRGEEGRGIWRCIERRLKIRWDTAVLAGADAASHRPSDRAAAIFSQASRVHAASLDQLERSGAVDLRPPAGAPARLNRTSQLSALYLSCYPSIQP